jgi:hypothetical protein
MRGGIRDDLVGQEICACPHRPIEPRSGDQEFTGRVEVMGNLKGLYLHCSRNARMDIKWASRCYAEALRLTSPLATSSNVFNPLRSAACVVGLLRKEQA